MTRATWARPTGRAPSTRRNAKGLASWTVALADARAAYDALRVAGYSYEGAAAILRTAVALWPDVAARMATGDDDSG